MKIKVYIMHSEKGNYLEDIYKPLLERGLMNNYYLILPFSEKYKSTYIKDLLNDSDIVICDLTNFNLLSKFELKTAQKLNKHIIYFIDKKDKKINKYKGIDIITYETNEELIDNIEKILESLNQKEIILKRENIYCLGKIQK